MTRTRDFTDVIRAQLEADPELASMVEEEAFNADIAMKVYELRKEARLTQRELAELVQTKQSVISRIENADYNGHSLKLLRRIATALGKKFRVDFYAVTKPVDTYTSSWQVEWSKDSWDLRIIG